MIATAPAAELRASARRRLLRAPVLVPAAVLALAAGLRLWGLTSPPATIWDEHWYVFDAYAYVGGVPSTPGPSFPHIANEMTWMHPPLAKWLIAAGVAPTNQSVLGWRLPPALFGIAGVLLCYLVALELWGSPWWAGLAASLLAMDGLHIVQSRLATLDIFVTTFVTAGVLFVLRDLRRTAAGPGALVGARPGLAERLFGTRERMWAGILFGCAAASKWSGAWAMAVAFALTLAAVRRNASGDDRRRDVRTVLRAYVLLPLAVYLASYIQFFVQHGPDLAGWVGLQWHMLDFQLHGVVWQPQASPAWSWLLLVHPIQYWGSPRTGAMARGSIWAIGNPALWWPFLALLPAAIVLAVRGDRPLRLALAFFASEYLPWLPPGRTEFLYYLLPAVPFMALVATGVVRRIPRRWRSRTAVVFLAANALTAAAFVPVWLGLPASTGLLRALRLLPGWP